MYKHTITSLFTLTLWCYAIKIHATTYDRFITFAPTVQEISSTTNHHLTLKILYDTFLAHLTPQKYPVLQAVGGSPGAGKTTYRKKHMNMHNLYQHDIDEIITKLPNYQLDVKLTGTMHAFTTWWPTARRIAHAMITFAITSKYSIAYDWTCGSKETVTDFIHAKEQDYYIKLIGLYVKKETAKQRISIRQQQEGRCVSESVLCKHRTTFSTLWPSYLSLVNEAILYDASQKTLTPIFSSTIGILKPKEYQLFLHESE